MENGRDVSLFRAPIFGVEDVARITGRSRSWVRLQILTGRACQSVPVADGRRRMFSIDDLEHLARKAGIDLLRDDVETRR